jgi:hypothetical protein
MTDGSRLENRHFVPGLENDSFWLANRHGLRQSVDLRFDPPRCSGRSLALRVIDSNKPGTARPFPKESHSTQVGGFAMFLASLEKFDNPLLSGSGFTYEVPRALRFLCS